MSPNALMCVKGRAQQNHAQAGVDRQQSRHLAAETDSVGLHCPGPSSHCIGKRLAMKSTTLKLVLNPFSPSSPVKGSSLLELLL